uniref:Uncharacterized protein n=1 Tax=Timema tahoe TaxID=61484 RepID=A0A7R9IPX5_9NEOP|nr:unnamed protein product [Timema tahoe]
MKKVPEASLFLLPVGYAGDPHREEIDTLCQRCAKSTKSSLVYPMCCQNKEEVMDWCKRYISFGIQ